MKSVRCDWFYQLLKSAIHRIAMSRHRNTMRNLYWPLCYLSTVFFFSFSYRTVPSLPDGQKGIQRKTETRDLACINNISNARDLPIMKRGGLGWKLVRVNNSRERRIEIEVRASQVSPKYKIAERRNEMSLLSFVRSLKNETTDLLTSQPSRARSPLVDSRVKLK